MDFSPEKIAELHKMLNGINITDDYISRGVHLTTKGAEKVAKRFGIQTSEVPAMIRAVSDWVKKDISEDASSDDERFSYEADYMGNLTLRDQQSGDDRFLQGDEAFDLASELTEHPDQEQTLIAPYFDDAPLNEEVSDDTPITTSDSGTFNFPYKGKFATARFGLDANKKFQLKVISLRDSEDNAEDITPDLQAKLNAIALTWVDKV